MSWDEELDEGTKEAGVGEDGAEEGQMMIMRRDNG